MIDCISSCGLSIRAHVEGICADELLPSKARTGDLMCGRRGQHLLPQPGASPVLWGHREPLSLPAGSELRSRLLRRSLAAAPPGLDGLLGCDIPSAALREGAGRCFADL